MIATRETPSAIVATKKTTKSKQSTRENALFVSKRTGRSVAIPVDLALGSLHGEMLRTLETRLARNDPRDIDRLNGSLSWSPDAA